MISTSLRSRGFGRTAAIGFALMLLAKTSFGVQPIQLVDDFESYKMGHSVLESDR